MSHRRVSLLLLALAALAARSAPAQPAAAPTAPLRAATLPRVSPDGRRIVYTRVLPDRPAELVVIDANGAPRTVLRDTTGHGLGGWTKGGGEITYTVSRGDTTTLHRVALAGGTPVPLLRLAGKSLHLSNDGRKLAWTVGSWTRGRVVVANADGSGARAITDSTAGWFNAAWSPDDRRIAITRLDSTRALAVWILEVDGSRARPLATFPDSVGRAQWPAWAPDGKRVAVQVGRHDRNEPARDRSDIWVVEVDTGRLVNLTPGEDPWLDETPSWSRDGTIVFQSTRSGRFELWRMNADGSAPVQLTR
jgi:TolB protein